MRPGVALACGRTQMGETPLHLAVYEYRVDVVKLLLKKGTNKDEQDNVRCTMRPAPPLRAASITPPSLH